MARTNPIYKAIEKNQTMQDIQPLIVGQNIQPGFSFSSGKEGDGFSGTAFYFALKNQRTDVALAIYNADPSVIEKELDGYNALNYCLKEGRDKSIDFIAPFAQKHKLPYQPQFNNCHKRFTQKHPDAAKELLDHNYHPSGDICHSDNDMLRFLINCGFDINSREPSYGSSFLTQAAGGKNAEGIALLLEHSGDMDYAKKWLKGKFSSSDSYRKYYDFLCEFEAHGINDEEKMTYHTSGQVEIIRKFSENTQMSYIFTPNLEKVWVIRDLFDENKDTVTAPLGLHNVEDICDPDMIDTVKKFQAEEKRKANFEKKGISPTNTKKNV